MFILPFVKDHLSWETISAKLSCFHCHWVMVTADGPATQEPWSLASMLHAFLGPSGVGVSISLFMATTRNVSIIPSFWIWGYVLHVEHISCVDTKCDQPQWAIPSLFSIALGLAGGKHHQKITIPVSRVLQNLAIPGYFPCILFYHYILSFLVVGL